jgi:hypothetical protein
VSLTRRDLEQLAGRGISAEEARSQLDFLRGGAAPLRLVRPCRVGDGIVVLDEAEIPALESTAREAAAGGRITVFIPASGAATRMFDHNPAGGRRPAHWPEIEAAIEARLPKGLIPFHREGDRTRTAFAEQLLEAAAYATDAARLCRVHATVMAGFEERFAAEAAAISRELGVEIALSLSRQESSTDTVALDPDGNPFRLADGSLLLRPGGHGALLPNLAHLARGGADLVVIKNIDNVLPVRRRAEVVTWKRRLLGLLVRLHAGDDGRPLRVCGVVPNRGEPGGGPYWVRGAGGAAQPQIVESAQVDHDDPTQAAAWSSATHFNPVDLACAVRDAAGRPYDLDRFRDPSAVFVTRKSHDGRPLLALEHPGLWNGAMAHWRTVFVEVPGSTFAPVKTVADLLRPEHL